MVVDVVPSLEKAIDDSFKKKVKGSKILKEKIAKLDDGVANHADSLEVGKEIGGLLAGAFRDNINSDTLPDGKMYYNIANRLISPRLYNNYELINGYGRDVQGLLNEKAGLNISPVGGDYDEDRAKGIVKYIADAEKFENRERTFYSSIENFSMAVVDNLVKDNFEMHYYLGINPRVIRSSNGKCCSWCEKLDGVYDYEEVKESGNIVFLRHRGCDCLVVYDPRKGAKKRKNIHSKKGLTKEEHAQTEEMLVVSEGLNARTIRDANKFAQSMGFKADYHGVDVKCANEWNRGLYYAKKRFPEACENIKFVGSSKRRYALAKKDIKEYYIKCLEDEYYKKLSRRGWSSSDISRWIKRESEKESNRLAKVLKADKRDVASSWAGVYGEDIKKDPKARKVCEILEGYRGVTLSDGYFNNYGKAIERLREESRTNLRPSGDFSVKAVFDHEFAHHLDGYLNVSASEKIRKLYDESSKEDITKGLSRYAWDNNNKNKYAEFIAEGFSEYRNNERPRGMAKIIGDEVLDLWRKKH